MTYRTNADGLGEPVISFDVVVYLCYGSMSQSLAVVFLIGVG